MIVMKFGGTSVEDAASVERVSEIIRARLHLGPTIVVSAMGKTTRKLLQAAEASASGDAKTTLGIVADLKTRHVSEARRLVKNSGGRQVFGFIDTHFDELKKLLEGLAILGEVPPRGLDKILSYGELLSSAVLCDALLERGISAQLVDARELIKTDDRFGSASPLAEVTNRNIKQSVPRLVAKGIVPVVQGFIGSTRDGATTTLGFEGSDYTATIVGSAIDADDIQIWKDVYGLMTADPDVFADARTVKFCSFDEAADLTHFGAKVLHPKAIYPASRKNIPVHIYNSKDPSGIGTAISASCPPCSNAVKSIAYKLPIAIVKASTNSDGGRATEIQEIVSGFREVFAKRRIQPLLISASSSRAVFAIDSRDLKHQGRDLIESASSYGTATVEMGRAVVSLVGAGLRSDAKVISAIFKAVDDIEIELISHGSSPITLSIVIAEADVERVIARLHAVLFERIDPEIFE